MNLKLRLFALTLDICACFALCPAQENSVIELSNADILTMVRAKLPTDAHVMNESNYSSKTRTLPTKFFIRIPPMQLTVRAVKSVWRFILNEIRKKQIQRH